MDLTSAYPLFSLTRDGTPEITTFGAVGIARGSSVKIKEPDLRIVARSLLKPWQFLSLNLGPEEPLWLMAVASHSGQKIHQQALERLTQITGIGPEDLSCPVAMPMDAAESEALRARSAPAQRLYHPCAGKHLAYSYAARSQGLSRDYCHLEHPLQKALSASLASKLTNPCVWSFDSCGLPTPAMTLGDHVRLWQSLAQNTSPTALWLKEMWAKEPLLVGGAGRLDTLITTASQGRLLAKEGADGLLAVQEIGGPATQANTIIIKISCGYNLAHLGLALLSVIRQNTGLMNRALLDLEQVLARELPHWVPKGQSFLPCPWEI